MIKSFILNNNSVEKSMNIQQVLVFSFLKNQASKSKKIFNISYLIMAQIKMTLLMFLVLKVTSATKVFFYHKVALDV